MLTNLTSEIRFKLIALCFALIAVLVILAPLHAAEPELLLSPADPAIVAQIEQQLPAIVPPGHHVFRPHPFATASTERPTIPAGTLVFIDKSVSAYGTSTSEAEVDYVFTAPLPRGSVMVAQTIFPDGRVMTLGSMAFGGADPGTIFPIWDGKFTPFISPGTLFRVAVFNAETTETSYVTTGFNLDIAEGASWTETSQGPAIVVQGDFYGPVNVVLNGHLVSPAALEFQPNKVVIHLDRDQNLSPNLNGGFYLKTWTITVQQGAWSGTTTLRSQLTYKG